MSQLKPEVAIIVAVAKNNVIGGDNGLLWKLPSDLNYFKKTTMGHPLIMGRKTYESIGRPLPGRKTFIVSRNPDFLVESCTTVDSIDRAIELAGDYPKVFVSGGGQIYQQALGLADWLYVTEIEAEPSGDVFFSYSPNQWQEVSRQDVAADDRNLYNHSFRVLKRIAPKTPAS